MEKLQISPSRRTVWNSLARSTRKSFSLLAMAVVLGITTWLAAPGITVYGQSGCGLKCQQGLYQCINGGGTNCESTFDNCIEGCVGL